MNKSILTLSVLLPLGACTNVEDTDNIPAIFSGVNNANLDINNNNISHSVAISDDDDGEAEIVAQSSVNTTYGTFSINSAGEWSYEIDVTNSAVTSLATDAQLTDEITITSKDGTISTISITISGIALVNTPATFSGDLTGELTNMTTVNIAGKVEVSDEDDQESTVVVQNNVDTTYGHFSISEDGYWNYSIDPLNSTLIALQDANDSVVETISIQSLDGTSANIDVTIVGVAIAADGPGFLANEGGNHIDGYTDAVPVVICTEVVSSLSALEDAAEEVVAGDTICLADGHYTGDLELRIEGTGTGTNPITVAAENPGKAVVSDGEISVRMGGEHLVLQGFVFRDGESGSSIIKFEKETECRYCRVTEVSIIDMDGGDYSSSKWIEYYGQYNRIDHSWFSGKESRGALLVLPRWIDEDTFASSGYPADYAQIDYNYFGDRPPAFGQGYAGSSDNEYEAVRLGLSTTHSAPAYSRLEYNYFERIQGEAEVVSNKSANNVIRHNTVRDSNGSIVTRHGASADISHNFVFGDDNPFSGGIRLVDDGHIVTNNYIEGARYLSSNWNGGIVLTTGDGASDTDNGYQNVENVLIAYNTIVDSVNSLNVYGGKKDVAPKNIYFVNNVIADAIGPVIRTNGENLPAGSTFSTNFVFGQSFSDNTNVTESTAGFTFADVMLQKAVDDLFRPTDNSAEMVADRTVNTGDFPLPELDMDGHTRTPNSRSGADVVSTSNRIYGPLTSENVGPRNYRPVAGKQYVEKVEIKNHDFDGGDLSDWIDVGGSGATIVTGADAFSRGYSLKLDSNAANVSQTLTVTPNTNYTLSAFLKGSAKLNIEVDGIHYASERKSSSYGFSSVTFNSGNATSAVLTAMVDDAVTNYATIINPNFDDKQIGWTVLEGTGIGQVQDSSNSAGGADGSIKFKWNVGDDTGTPYQPYIAQTLDVVANTDYTLSIYHLLKTTDDSSILFGAFAEGSDILITDATKVSEKESIYSTLKNGGATKGDDSFYEDSLTFNSGSATSLTIFAQFNSTDGGEIRVDQFALSYDGTPSDGTEAFFDSIRLVSHPLSPAESLAAED